MTAEPIRDTPFATWKDEDAWMESMKGERWNKILNEEQSLVKSYISLAPVQKRIQSFQTIYESTKQGDSIPFLSQLVQIHWNSAFFKTWNFIGNTTKHESRDIIATPYGVLCTTDIGNGSEEFELQFWDSPTAKEPLWKKSPVGPDIVPFGTKVLYLNVKHKLMYYQVLYCDVLTGRHEHLLWDEKDPQVNLALERLEDGRILFSRENSQDFTYYEIQDGFFFKKVASKYKLPSSWIMPLFSSFGIEWVWRSKGFIIVKQHGQKHLYRCSHNTSAEKLLSIPGGSILVDPFAVWAGILPCLVRVDKPCGTSFYRLTETTFELIKESVHTKIHVERIEGRSAIDYEPVHGIIAYLKQKRPDHLLVIGYGAYGMPTSVGSVMNRWAPLLENGWAIAYGFLRGGGDHTEAWAKAGRREGRVLTIGDFEGIIRSAQMKLDISPEHTIIYGRSAGGLLVGGTLTNHPEGYLMSGIYTEVPYVDELRTTTNKDLPLTTLEYNEFGNPSERLEDFLSVGLLSPADAATTCLSPSIFVLTRTAENDSQVYAYESLKWIGRLRKNAKTGAPKLCIVERGQGHFTPPEKTLEQWTVDCALLDAWIHKKLPSMR